MNKLKLKSQTKASVSKPESFNSKPLLLDSKKSTAKKKAIRMLMAKKSKSKKATSSTFKPSTAPAPTPKSPNLYSKVERIPAEMQNEIANHLYRVYSENHTESQKQSNIAWGLGIMLPTALEIAGAVSGLHPVTFPSVFATTLLFALTFRHTFGNELVAPSHEIKTIKSRKAAHLLLSGKITSHPAQDQMAEIVRSDDILDVLFSGNVTSSKAQISLLKRVSSKLSNDKKKALLKCAFLSAAAKKMLN